ncbi:carbohydrate binding family 9 domain-containing protein [Psychrobium sp. 1_MG-2023]|uniref:carbohydrate binding family 9 domain-containing protein n=1 Tax=Psychrobium sp. 1_MG-2023 TaxID=3062624 RepID=UPI000C3377E5|nr:carbohydrate binding family 9 domain-containing protein [Psychrobium sp. 1_MG-2023]MDP2562717.1 DUF5916 domain-containing protein [Psychrobium sp. 1_MG-2023]PKF54020.1 hydrolase [Alteromonadales bacterium alter-6D02]
MLKMNNSKVFPRFTTCAALVSLAMTSHFAQAKTSITIPQIKNKIEIDGEMNETAWANATKLDLAYEKNPGEGIAARVKTTAYFYEDGENLNVAIVANDPNPEQIRAHLSDRDKMFQDDWAGIVIDTFNDKRTAYEFFVNPIGVQGDIRMEDNNGWREDTSWDAIWDSAGKITDKGYIVEMSIPFKALRFPEAQGPLTWNIAVLRTYPRDHRYQFTNYKDDRTVQCNICQFDNISGFSNIKPSKNIQVTPTLTINRSDKREAEQANWDNGDGNTDAGIDLRWGVTPDMVLNATLNPDFSQVEADSGQLNVNNTFSLFYRERRPFFLDGADYFDGERLNLVHTRNIANPDYGVKLTGKTGNHTYALLSANDEATAFLLPGNQGSDLAELDKKSQATIARYKMDIGERSSIGAHLTNRQGDGYKNTVASVDGRYWFNDQDSFSYQAAWSDSDNNPHLVKEYELEEKQTGHAISMQLKRDTRDYTLRASYSDTGEDFRADLGFVRQADYRRAVIGGERRWYGEDGAALNQWGFWSDVDRTEDQNGLLLEEEAEIHLNLQGRHQFYSNMGVVTRNKHHKGKYFDETQFMAFARIRPVSAINVRAFTRIGKQIDYANVQLGDTFVLNSGLNWNVNDHLSIDLDHNYNRLDVDEGRLFTANLTDARFTYQFDLKSYLKLVIQYRDVDRNVELYKTPDDYDASFKGFNTQLLYSYKLNPQSLIFVGYADKGQQDDEFDKLKRTDRTVFAKFSYAWQM